MTGTRNGGKGRPKRARSARRGLGLALIAVGALIVSACTVGSVMTLRPKVDVGAQTASVPRAVVERPEQSNPVRSRPRLAAYPRLSTPRSSSPVMPADEVACRRELKRLGVRFREQTPIDDGGACRIDHPVEVSALSGNIAMKPAATLSCDMAAAFARWTRKELAPAARWRYFSGIKAINQGSSYSCRNIAGTSTPSEHSRGNALDVMSIELENGREIDVRRPGFFAFRQKGLLNTVRADGCDYFTTVLGPGYDAAHKDHFHFDIKDRRNGYRACR